MLLFCADCRSAAAHCAKIYKKSFSLWMTLISLIRHTNSGGGDSSSRSSQITNHSLQIVCTLISLAYLKAHTDTHSHTVENCKLFHYLCILQWKGRRSEPRAALLLFLCVKQSIAHALSSPASTKLITQREKTNWEQSQRLRTKTAQTNSVRTTKRTKSERIEWAQRQREWEQESHQTSERTERSERLKNADATCVPRRCLFSEPASFSPRCQLHEGSKSSSGNNKLGLGLPGLASIIYICICFFLLGAVAAAVAAAAAAGQGSHISWDNYYYNNFV